MISQFRLRRLIEAALDEDIGSGDVTTQAILTGTEVGMAAAIAKDDIRIAGIEVFKEVFLCCNKEITFVGKYRDGEKAGQGDVIAEVTGSLQDILIAERVALNFFQRMCGIATMTQKYAEAVKGTKAKILDTRKTVACHRELDKYAVRIGGGCNHRVGLYGGVLIKDNHIRAAGSISKAVAMTSRYAPPTLKIEVEATNIAQVEESLKAGADIIMLDNMNSKDMRDAIALINGKALVEASGNVTLTNVRTIAETGVDFISVGALTHSVQAADISLNIVKR